MKCRIYLVFGTSFSNKLFHTIFLPAFRYLLTVDVYVDEVTMFDHIKDLSLR